MTDDTIDSVKYYVDTVLKGTLQDIQSSARQAGKSHMVNYMVQQLNMTNIKPSNIPKSVIKDLNFWKMYGVRIPLINIDDNNDPDKFMPEPKEKDWECKIPNPDPFYRTFSSPSEKTRAKARAKRKKK